MSGSTKFQPDKSSPTSYHGKGLADASAEAGDFPDLTSNMSKAWRAHVGENIDSLKKRVEELELWHVGLGTIAKENPNLEKRFNALEKKVYALEEENRILADALKEYKRKSMERLRDEEVAEASDDCGTSSQKRVRFT